MTKNFWLLIGLLIVMVSVGLLAVESSILILAIPLLVYLLTAVAYAPGEQKIKVERSLSTDRVTEGMAVTVYLEIRNEGSRMDQLILPDLTGYDFEILSGDPCLAAQLNPGEQVSHEFAFEAKRGRYQFDRLPIATVDPFGLIAFQEEIAVKGELTVFPQITELKSIQIKPAQTKGFAGPISIRMSGSGVDFLGVRQYQLGDSLRRINWRASERHLNTLFTNEYEQERIADVGIILDARPHCDRTYRGRRMFEYGVHAAASLSKMFLDDGHSISMLIYSGVVTHIFPGYGKFQYERILETLATADTSFNFSREQLRIPRRFLPPRGQLVYISPTPPADYETIQQFQELGYSVIVLSLDSLFFEEDTLTDLSSPEAQLASRFAYIERKLMLENLSRAGVLVESWQVDQAFLEIAERIRANITIHHRTVRGLHS